MPPYGSSVLCLPKRIPPALRLYGRRRGRPGCGAAAIQTPPSPTGPMKRWCTSLSLVRRRRGRAQGTARGNGNWRNRVAGRRPHLGARWVRRRYLGRLAELMLSCGRGVLQRALRHTPVETTLPSGVYRRSPARFERHQNRPTRSSRQHAIATRSTARPLRPRLPTSRSALTSCRGTVSRGSASPRMRRESCC